MLQYSKRRFDFDLRQEKNLKKLNGLKSFSPLPYVPGLNKNQFLNL
jgi:hypothetical protein